jgi:hypothetical protein
MTFVFTSGMKHLLIELCQKIHSSIIHRNQARYVVRPAATPNMMRQQSEASYFPAGWGWHGSAHAVQPIERSESALLRCPQAELAAKSDWQRSRVIGLVGTPESIRIDNGPEFVGQVLDAWAALLWTLQRQASQLRMDISKASTGNSGTSA